jgi:uncharacterized damage-inducible protein DinB
MTGTNAVRRPHRYRAWSNGQLLVSARGLSSEQLHARLAIGQGSVWPSQVHLLGADRPWLNAFEGHLATALPR